MCSTYLFGNTGLMSYTCVCIFICIKVKDKTSTHCSYSCPFAQPVKVSFAAYHSYHLTLGHPASGLHTLLQTTQILKIIFIFFRKLTWPACLSSPYNSHTYAARSLRLTSALTRQRGVSPTVSGTRYLPGGLIRAPGI